MNTWKQNKNTKKLFENALKLQKQRIDEEEEEAKRKAKNNEEKRRRAEAAKKAQAAKKKTLTRTQTLEQAGAAGKKQVKARKGLLSEVHLKFYKNQVKQNNPTARGRELTKLLDELIWQKIQNKSINNNAKNPNIAGKFAGK